MRQPEKKRRTVGIRGQLMWFLCFICLLLLVLFWFLCTQLLEPLYTTHIQKQLTEQADAIVQKLDDAIADGQTLSYWGFGSQLYVNSQFFNQLSSEIYENGGMSSFCVDISDVTLRQIFKVENLSYCNLHRTRPTDENSELPSYSTARAMRQLCRETGSCVRKINPPTPSGTVELMVGRTTSDGSYTVLVTTSLMHVSEAGEVMSTVLPLAAALIFAFSMSAAWLFSEWFTKPLRQLSGAARQVAQGDYAVQVETNRRDELGDLAQEFNHMAKEVQHAAQMQRDLLANVSHDLRTPLTSIYGACSTVIENYDSLGREQKLKLLGEVCEDAQWLNRMVENLLSVTRIDSEKVSVKKTPTVLEELIDAVLVKFKKSHPGVNINVELPDDFIVIPMDSMLIRQVLTNLLENAVLHAEGMTKLTLRVFTLGNRAVFEVADNGCGIPKERLRTLFTGTLPSESGADSGKHGMGIGLSVCAAIIKAHGGEIKAESKPGEGTIIRFWLETEEIETEETEDEQ